MSPDLDTRVMATNPMKDEQLERVFGDDASRRLLREIRHRRVAIMPEADDRVRELNPPDKQHASGLRRAWLVAGGAAAVVLVVIGVVAFVRSDDGVPVASEPVATTAAPASTTPEAATTAVPAPIDPLAVVTSSNEAYNAGDLEAWLAHFSEDAVVAGFRKADAAVAFAPVFAANAIRTTEGVCRLVVVDADGASTVECDHVEVNDFTGPAGFVHPDTAGYIVGADGLIEFTSVPNSAQYRDVTRYETLFWFWLEEAHPDAFASIESELVGTGDNPPGAGGKFPETVADMELALQYIDEFVAQSDRYPLATEG